MKSQYTLFVLLFASLAFWGCEAYIYETTENYPPAVPRGVMSITGDERVTLSWYPNDDADLAGYNVYRSGNAETGFYYLATTSSEIYVDTDVENGVTYYYAVTAFDLDGNESELSYDLVYDTPRPEGYGVRIFDMNQNPEVAGYDFSDYLVVDFRDELADIYFEYDPQSNGLYINRTADDTDIQDYGYTETLDDVSYAPEKGWSQLGYVEAIEGHTYIIWTHDNHFAKIRLTRVTPTMLEFDWAYQVDPGNPELLLQMSGVNKARNLDKSRTGG